jgi:hypothetical protein
MSNGTALNIPQIGEAYEPGKLYVLRAKAGYGDTGNTAGGASDGLDMWTDTQETINLINVNSSDVVVHRVQFFTPTAFTGSVTLSLGPSTGATEFLAATAFAATEVQATGFFNSSAAATTTVMEGYRFGSTTTIDLVAGGADVAVGIAEIYILYSYGPPEQSDSGGSSNT